MVAQGLTRSRIQAGLRRQWRYIREHLGRQFGAQRFKQSQFVRFGQALGFKVATHKITTHPRVCHVEQLAVHPFVVHGQGNRLANALVLELGQTRVEHKALEVSGVAVLEFFFNQRAVVKQLAFVAARPFARHKRLYVIKLARFEAFKLRGCVLVHLVGDAVEIKHAFAHAQVFRPVVGVAHIFNVFAEIDFANFVWSGANGNVCDHLV